ncbi:MAG: CPBP family intramembrane metalloprotease [Maricaulaceae bacterium]|nr:CPBP family intramembrane metalloprotease [Maricaulaceae bacterium]
MTQELVNTGVQVAVALAVALVFWLIFGRKKANFFRYTGFIAPSGGAMLKALVAALIFSALTIGLFILPALQGVAAGPDTVAGRVREMGLGGETLAIILIIAFIKTSGSEEILFRGVIAKRLIGWLGFIPGNTIHALIFGAVHLVIFAAPGGPAFDPLLAAAVVGVGFTGGWVMAWLNERAGGGSIAPGWLMHGLSNAIAYPALAFL